MKPYVRSQWKKNTNREATIGLLDARTPPGASLRPGSPARLRFLRAFSEAVEEQGAKRLEPMAHCVRLDVVHEHPCGQEQRTVGPWCGHPYCAPCARERAARAVREARRAWSGEQVAVIEVPIGNPGELELPSEEAVVGVRDAWARATRMAAEATGLERIEALPRTILTPDGLVLFLRFGGEQTRQLASIETATNRVGLRGVGVRVTSAEMAAIRLYRALILESQRFWGRVSADLGRLEAFPWASHDHEERALLRAARRWLARASERQQSARRPIVFGSKRSLPAVTGRVEADATPRPCPRHGRVCLPVGTSIRDALEGGRKVWRGSEPFNERPTRQWLTQFCRRITRRRARSEGETTQVLMRAA